MPKIDVASLNGPSKPEKPDKLLKEPAAATAEAPTETAAQPSRWRLPAYAPLAAGIALAALIGAVAGAGTTFLLRHDGDTANAVASETRALQTTVAQLDSEIAALEAENARRPGS